MTILFLFNYFALVCTQGTRPRHSPGVELANSLADCAVLWASPTTWNLLRRQVPVLWQRGTALCDLNVRVAALKFGCDSGAVINFWPTFGVKTDCLPLVYQKCRNEYQLSLMLTVQIKVNCRLIHPCHSTQELKVLSVDRMPSRAQQAKNLRRCQAPQWTCALPGTDASQRRQGGHPGPARILGSPSSGACSWS